MHGSFVFLPLSKLAKRESFLAIIYGGENPGNTRHSCKIPINRNNKPHEADLPSNLLESIKCKRREGGREGGIIFGGMSIINWVCTTLEMKWNEPEYRQGYQDPSFNSNI